MITCLCVVRLQKYVVPKLAITFNKQFVCISQKKNVFLRFFLFSHVRRSRFNNFATYHVWCKCLLFAVFILCRPNIFVVVFYTLNILLYKLKLYRSTIIYRQGIHRQYFFSNIFKFSFNKDKLINRKLFNLNCVIIDNINCPI